MADIAHRRIIESDTATEASSAATDDRSSRHDGSRMVAWGIALLVLGIGMVVVTARGAGGSVVTYLAMGSPFVVGCLIIGRALSA